MTPDAPIPRSSLVTLVAVAAIGPTALNIVAPSMPGLQQVFAVDYGTAQLVLTAFLIAFAITQLIFGPLSDSFGRRPVLLSGLALFLAGTFVCLLAPGIEVLLVGRVLQAIGGCAGLALSRAMVRDLYGRDRAASMLGYLAVAMVVPPTLAPAMGGYLDEWYGWRASFVLLLAVGAAVLALAALTLRETLHAERQTASVRNHFVGFAGLLSQRRFCGYALQIGFSSAAFFGFVGGAPYVMTDLMGRPPSEYGVYFMLVAGMFMLGNLVSGRVSERIGVDRMISWGVSISVAGAAILVAVTAAGALGPANLFGAAAIVVLGYGVSLPNSLAAAVSVDPARAGAAAGFSGFMQMGTGAVASQAVGTLLKQSVYPLVVVMALACVIAFVAHASGRERFVEREA